jgi:AcrR family transcriptional regulator
MTAMSTANPGEHGSQWEQRSATRVLEAGRDQLLARSRRIVEAAYAMLEDGELDDLTIRALLKKTGLSRRAFYERFGGKDELMLAVFEHTIRLATQHLERQVARLADPLERLELIVNTIVLGKSTPRSARSPAAGRRGAAMSREHLRLAQSHPAELQAALCPLLELMAQQLAEGVKQGTLRAGDPARLASFLYNLVSTTVHTELLAHEVPDPAHTALLAKDLWLFCRRAIVREPA